VYDYVYLDNIAIVAAEDIKRLHLAVFGTQIQIIEIAANADLCITIIDSPVTIIGNAYSVAKGISIKRSINSYQYSIKKLVLNLFLQAIEQSFHRRLPWGILTGIRPLKLYRKLNETTCMEDAEYTLKDFFLVSEQKISLLRDIYVIQEQILKKQNINKQVSIYVGIPYCPSKCNYCTFLGYVDRTNEEQAMFFYTLLHELRWTLNWLVAHDMSVASIYIGGGTPSMLSANQIEQLFQTIEQGSNNYCEEITFEAGRPDTITIEKLDILKQAGVNRISINPQTFNEHTLRKMNRKHSVEDILTIYEHARKRNFEQINMDLILGLPNESLADVKNTLQVMNNLLPESVTIHTLSLKTKSKLKEQIPIEDFRRATDIGRMVEASQAWALSAGYKPYYLYRQKNIAGNLENVGYAKSDKYSLYNIYIMEELMPIIGIGCGSVSKIIDGKTGKLNRLPNPSEPQYYIQHIDDIIGKKQKHLPELLTI